MKLIHLPSILYDYSASPWSGIPRSGMITMKRYGFSAKKWPPSSGIRIFKVTPEVFELKTCISSRLYKLFGVQLYRKWNSDMFFSQKTGLTYSDAWLPLTSGQLFEKYLYRSVKKSEYQINVNPLISDFMIFDWSSLQALISAQHWLFYLRNKSMINAEGKKAALIYSNCSLLIQLQPEVISNSAPEESFH